MGKSVGRAGGGCYPETLAVVIGVDLGGVSSATAGTGAFCLFPWRRADNLARMLAVSGNISVPCLENISEAWPV